ncbi:Isonitrile hydratase [Apiospora arundinis]
MSRTVWYPPFIANRLQDLFSIDKPFASHLLAPKCLDGNRQHADLISHQMIKQHRSLSTNLVTNFLHVSIELPAVPGQPQCPRDDGIQKLHPRGELGAAKATVVNHGLESFNTGPGSVLVTVAAATTEVNNAFHDSCAHVAAVRLAHEHLGAQEVQRVARSAANGASQQAPVVLARVDDVVVAVVDVRSGNLGLAGGPAARGGVEGQGQRTLVFLRVELVVVVCDQIESQAQSIAMPSAVQELDQVGSASVAGPKQRDRVIVVVKAVYRSVNEASAAVDSRELFDQLLVPHDVDGRVEAVKNSVAPATDAGIEEVKVSLVLLGVVGEFGFSGLGPGDYLGVGQIDDVDVADVLETKSSVVKVSFLRGLLLVPEALFHDDMIQLIACVREVSQIPGGKMMSNLMDNFSGDTKKMNALGGLFREGNEIDFHFWRRSVGVSYVSIKVQMVHAEMCVEE